ncbi:peptidase S8 [Actinoplanes sp. ATCC 53533]|uniref:S8 family serine peptidase n=1 Tax=Actinoplanes sp. ATCC 53533 TaxID=1288362 RepID=UPI000F774A68|nr:S8 family serine peptidase [Actinoplanes sp. ATCC 53533]RSM72538.1 peptidase S8 [Actinoplanes sp. ATCC 53533]
MNRPKRAAAGLAAAVAVAGLLLVPHDATAGTAEGADTAGAAPRTVTLLTGDRVTALEGDDDVVSVEPGAGREGVTFLTRRVRGHLSIIPNDALGLLGAGRLDPRLFDVTTLLGYGYDDRRADLPLIVMTGGAKAAVPIAGAAVARRLPRLGGVAMRQHRTRPGAFWESLTTGSGRDRTMRPGVAKVWLDGVRQPALDASIPQIGAPTAWQAGYTGSGVSVAVLDTGIDDTHPDLAGRVTARRDFTGGVEDDRDIVGHGTHVASTIAGSGAASGGRYRGVAPGTHLLDGKVCVEYGCEESWILAGMEWAAAEQRAKVVSMSLGGADTPEIDPLEQAVNTLTEQYGTLFVIAAGNEHSPESVGSPASADAALAVGAVDRSDLLADFSSRGPRVGDGAVKPDITAPGVAITAARGRDATAVGGEPGDPYVTLSGTSMAAPHVAGAAAILAQQHPDWTGQRLKATLMASAKPTAGVDAFGQGAGRVDVARAITQQVTAVPPSLSFGIQAWPHADDDVLTRDITYRNTGTAAVTLALALDSAAPAGTFAVSPAAVTIPGGGAATVTVSADTRVEGPDGRITATLAAAGDGQSVSTPLGVDKQIETHEITLRHIGRSGAPGAGFGVDVVGWDGTKSFFALVRGSVATLRVPAGRYVLFGALFGLQPAPTMTFVAQPVLDATADRTVTMDERHAKPNTVTVPRASATQVHAHVGLTVLTPGEPIIGGQYATTFDEVFTLQVGDDRPGDALVSHLTGVWAEPGADSPYSYAISHYQPGGMISGYRRTVAESELAKVRLTTAGGDDGLAGLWFTTSRLAGRNDENRYETLVMPLRVRQPSTVTRYFNTDGGVQWRSGLRQVQADGEYRGPYTFGAWTGYERGRSYDESWNQAVFGPAFPRADDRSTGVTRLADTVTVNLPLFGDGAGRVADERNTGTTTLFRDGVKLGTGAEFTVPPADASFRLEVNAEREPQYQLSTRVSAAWEFRSGHVDGTRAAALPLWAVRFAPRLDEDNTAPAGRAFTIPVVATPAPSAGTGRLRELTVDVSYDDGATWTRATMRGGKALLHHPRGSGFVSLRARAKDTGGNGVDQTIIHAYRYGKGGS